MDFVHLDMTRPISLVVVSTIVLLCYTQLTNCDTCVCACCKENGCTATYQGSFSLDACTSLKCMTQCRLKYSGCPPDGASGHTNGRCTSDPPGHSHRQKSNIILITLFLSILWIIKLQL